MFAASQRRLVLVAADADHGNRARPVVFSGVKVDAICVVTGYAKILLGVAPLFGAEPGHLFRARVHVRVSGDDEGSVFAAYLVRAPTGAVSFVADLHVLHVHVPDANLPFGFRLGECALEEVVVASVSV